MAWIYPAVNTTSGNVEIGGQIFHNGGSSDSERCSDLPEVAQMVSDRAGAGTQVSDVLGIKQAEHLYLSELD